MKKFFIVLISIILICLTALGVIGYFVEKDEANYENQSTVQQGESITEWKVLDTDTLDIDKIEGYTPGGTVVEKTVEEIQNSTTNNKNNSTNKNNSNSTTNNNANSSQGESSGSDSSLGDNSSDSNTSNEGSTNDNNDNNAPPATETPSAGDESDNASNVSYTVAENTSLDSKTIAIVASLETATDATKEEKVTVTEVGGLELPFTPPYKEMEILSIGGYTGKFIEDGSDDKKENVLAMVIKNTSDKVIDYGEIIIKIQGQNVGLSFKVSDLKPGAAALVLESSGEVTFSEDDKYIYLDSRNEFVDEMDMMTDEIKITTEDGKITVENISEENLNTVYVYYKTVSPGGCYLGGLTYRAKFVKLTSGKIETVQTHHFNKINSEIIRVESVKE